MKTNITGLSVRPVLFLICALGLADGVKSFAQQPPPVKKEAPVSGYLGKASPTGLRFAPPPKPPVAYLPPLPITYDPQPVFTPEFASPLAELPKPPSGGPPPGPSSQPHVPGPEIVSPIYNSTTGQKQGQIPMTAGEVGVVSPQMLVKFFQNGQPGEVQMLLSNPVGFNVPVKEERRSSTATYEKK